MGKSILIYFPVECLCLSLWTGKWCQTTAINTHCVSKSRSPPLWEYGHPCCAPRKSHFTASQRYIWWRKDKVQCPPNICVCKLNVMSLTMWLRFNLQHYDRWKKGYKVYSQFPHLEIKIWTEEKTPSASEKRVSVLLLEKKVSANKHRL